MVRSKNKPKKNAAAVSPAAIPTGTTEVIAPVAAEATAPNPTFTQIGMAGMIGMLSSPPTFAEPASTNPTDTDAQPEVKDTTPVQEEKTEEPKTEEPKAEEPKAEEPKAEEPKAAEPTPVESTGIFGFFRRFYNSLGGAIHR